MTLMSEGKGRYSQVSPTPKDMGSDSDSGGLHVGVPAVPKCFYRSDGERSGGQLL